MVKFYSTFEVNNQVICPKTLKITSTHFRQPEKSILSNLIILPGTKVVSVIEIYFYKNRINPD